MDSKKKGLVLVTGASGYLAGHIINTLLLHDFRVRGTVRNLKDEKKIGHIYKICPEKKDDIELVEADLTNEGCWDSVV